VTKSSPTKEIKLVDFGIANNYHDCIEIHKDLPKFPKLYDAIMQHEKGHEGLNFREDFKLDINNVPGLDYGELRNFMYSRPKTWLQFLPIWKHPTRGWIYDKVHLLIYGILITSILLIIVFGVMIGKSI